MACPKCGCKETYPYVEDDILGLPDDQERCAACGAIFYFNDHADEDDAEPVEQGGNLPELPTCTKSQTADVVGVIPTISMRHVDYDDGTHGVELTVTGLTSEQQAEAAMLHIQRLFCGEEISEQ